MSDPIVVRITAFIESDPEIGEHKFHRLLNVVADWRGPGYRFEITQRLYAPDNIDRRWIDDADQLWFFGSCASDCKPPTPTQLEWIRAAMNRGVGVFATGDHLSIGGTLCGLLPRVREMRVWGGPDAPDTDSARYDSTVRSAVRDVYDAKYDKNDSEEQQTDDSDDLGKVIWPRYVDKERPHELFRISLRNGLVCPIRFLPDHRHEGRIIEDFTVLRALVGTPDYAAGSDAARCCQAKLDFAGNVWPQVVAWSTRRAFDAAEVPLAPRIYPVVSVYDPGNTLPAGRIVVDSTFHHWVDANLTRFRLTPASLHLEQYAINIANWLIREDQLARLYDSAVAYLLRHPLVSEKLRKEAMKLAPPDDIRRLEKTAGELLAVLRMPGDMLERILIGKIISNEPQFVQREIESIGLHDTAGLEGAYRRNTEQQVVIGARLTALKQAADGR
jgi:hypothetical protein